MGWPLTELGRIRLRRGDVRGAEEAFRAAHDIGWDAQPGLALVHLARGDIELAAESIRDALANAAYVPSKELPPHTELRRAPLLEAQVEIEVAAGDLARARAAADDRPRGAPLVESKALGASAALAHGRVALAEGDAATARRELEEAVHLWSEIGAPYETAVAQMGLAHALRAAGNEAGALLELRAARSAFERVGAVHRVAEADRARGDAGSTDVKGQGRADGRPVPVVREGESADAPEVADENVFRREGDYWVVAYQGVVVRLRD